MPDAGDPDIAPTARRYGNGDVIACYENMLHWAKTADALGLRHHVAHRAPLPVRGLRGPAEPHHVRRPRRRPDRARSASARCSTSSRSGTRCGWPRTSPWPTSSRAGAWSSASGGAPCRARRGPSAPSSPRATTRCPPSTTASTARCSRRRWRSSSWPGARSASTTGASTSSSRPTTSPTAARYVNDLTLIPKPRRPVDIYQPVTSPETIEYVPRAGHKAVYWLQNPDSQKREVGPLRGHPCRGRHVRSARARTAASCSTSTSRRTHEEAVARGGPGHDEFCKFLAPYGRFSSYRYPDGSKVPVRLPAHARGLDAAEDPGRRLRRRRGRHHRLLARPARPRAHLLLLRLPGPGHGGHRRADAPGGRRGLPPPGRAGGAPAAPDLLALA